MCQIESNLRNQKKFCLEIHEPIIGKPGFLFYFLKRPRDAFVHTYKNNDIKAA